MAGTVIEIEKYGHAVLDVSVKKFNDKGFALGDVVTVESDDYTKDMPYFDGYYVNHGEYMVRAYSGNENIALCINYGNFSEATRIDIGDKVKITLKEQGAELATQELHSLVYSTERTDFISDEVFADFRPVVMGDIVEGRLYRCASPIDNVYGRASTANKLAESVGINAVMNMANTSEEVEKFAEEEGFSSYYYKNMYDSGRVVTLGMSMDFTSDEFAEDIVEGFTFLSQGEFPYLIHCTEGKEKSGFATMLLGALMGTDLEEITNDHMTSYANYYNLTVGKDAEKYERVINKNLMEMLYVVTGLERGTSLEGVDLATAAKQYLISHGMEEDAIETLKENLSKASE